MRVHSFAGVEHFDLTAIHPDLAGFWGGCGSATHAYFAPHRMGNVYSGRVVRIAFSDFTASGVEHFDMASVYTHLKGYGGAFASSQHVYYSPTYSGTFYSGLITRVSQSDFSPTGCACTASNS